MLLGRIASMFTAVALVIAGFSAPALAGPDKAAQVRNAYAKARQLYRQGKYAEAIKAFDEVKDLRYHPILDYGIASCYEALRDYKRAIYYLKKYVRNTTKFKMSPKHPKVADVNEKIKVLENRPASGTTPGGTTPGGTTPGGTTPGGTTPGATPAHTPASGDPVPGPDPYAIPPAPGAGSTGGVYGGGGAPPPPAAGVRRRATGPARNSFMFSVDFGASAFAGAGANSYLSNASTGGGFFVTAMWRFLRFLAIGVHAGLTGQTSDFYDEADPLIFGIAALEARAIIPVRTVDLWGSLGVGYAGITQSYLDDSATVRGPAIAAAAGLDLFLSRTFSIGALFRIYKMFPSEFCSDSTGCGDLGDDADPGFAWYAGLSITYHLPLSFGRRK